MALCVTFLAFGFAPFAGAQAPEQAAFASNLEVSDVPTAYTLYSRMFHLNFRMFRGGGILAKALASFNNSLMLGLSMGAGNVIGNGSVEFEEDPLQAVAKVKLLNLRKSEIVGAVGYDGQGYDAARPRGLYGVVTKELQLSEIFLSVHGGAGMSRLKSYRSDDDTNIFAGVSAFLSEEVFVGAEYDDMLYNNGSVNIAVGYAWDVGLRIELDFKSLFQGKEAHHRVLKILYTF